MSESTQQSQPIDLSAGLVPSNPAPKADPTQIDLSAGLVPTPHAPADPNDRLFTGGTGTVSAIKPPAHIGEALEQWTNNVANDIKYGTDTTGVGTVLKKMGAHGVYAGNPEAVGDFMASLPLGAIKALRGAAKVEQGKFASGGKDIVSGTAQAATMPLAFAGPEESALSKEGLLSDAASVAGKATELTRDTVEAVKGWQKAHPVAAAAIKTALGAEAYKHRGQLEQLLKLLP